MQGYRSVHLYKVDEPGIIKRAPILKSIRSIHSLSAAKAGEAFKANQSHDELNQSSKDTLPSHLAHPSLHLSAEQLTMNEGNAASWNAED